MPPSTGISIAERSRDRASESVTCFDDPSKHSKSHRQTPSIPAKIPSRDAFPADTFNIHPSLSERSGKSKYSYYGGSITGIPITETTNPDITEYTATNVIPTTDGQFYTSNSLFIDSHRPSLDSGPSVSRIGSNAQLRLMKVNSIGLKNWIGGYRTLTTSNTNA